MLKNYRYISGVFILIFLLFAIPLKSQTRVCMGEEVILAIDEYRGDLQWEISFDRTKWSKIPNAINDSLSVVVLDTVYYRAKILEGSCDTVFSEITTIYVYPEPVVELSSMDTVCYNYGSILLTGGYPAGGIYSGPGIEDGSFIPTIAGIGTHKIIYTYQIPGSNCFYFDSADIYVRPEPEVELSILDTVCINTTGFPLNGGFPVGGVYSGPGIIDGKFIPLLAGEGTHNIIYTYHVPGLNCFNSDSSDITVIPLPSTANAGADSIGIFSDSIQLYANQAINGTGHWSIISGNGGSFDSINDPVTIFRANVGEYLLEWTIFTSCGASSDTVKLLFIETVGTPCPGTPIVIDSDGNIYPTVLIGNKCWMGKNLNTGEIVMSQATGTRHSDVRNNGIIERYCHDNDSAKCEEYGGLYDWNEMMKYNTVEGSRGICPEGWHIPSVADWDDLDDNFEYGQSGIAIKEGGSTGFEAQLGGDRHSQGAFFSFGASGFFWSSTQENENDSWSREVCDCNNYVDQVQAHKATGFSVRCVKDN